VTRSLRAVALLTIVLSCLPASAANTEQEGLALLGVKPGSDWNESDTHIALTAKRKPSGDQVGDRLRSSEYETKDGLRVVLRGTKVPDGSWKVTSISIELQGSRAYAELATKLRDGGWGRATRCGEGSSPRCHWIRSSHSGGLSMNTREGAQVILEDGVPKDPGTGVPEGLAINSGKASASATRSPSSRSPSQGAWSAQDRSGFLGLCQQGVLARYFPNYCQCHLEKMIRLAGVAQIESALKNSGSKLSRQVHATTVECMDADPVGHTRYLGAKTVELCSAKAMSDPSCRCLTARILEVYPTATRFLSATEDSRQVQMRTSFEECTKNALQYPAKPVWTPNDRAEWVSTCRISSESVGGSSFPQLCPCLQQRFEASHASTGDPRKPFDFATPKNAAEFRSNLEHCFDREPEGYERLLAKLRSQCLAGGSPSSACDCLIGKVRMQWPLPSGFLLGGASNQLKSLADGWRAECSEHSL